MTTVQTVNNQVFVEAPGERVTVASANDAVDLLGICGSQRTNRLLLHDGALPEAFFTLKSGVAGEVLQKFSTYRMKVAIIVSRLRTANPRIAEMVRESNAQSGTTDGIAYFQNRKSAVIWLTS